jgi:hypothetical protein|tara:strand:+ start:2402 stop:2794 length:393 start_codon:yes stop_codon:yes gene_type:complete
MSNEKISLKQLPIISEINNGDLILVETAAATNTLDFKDFVIGLENTTFASTISSHTTEIDSISSIIEDQFFINDNLNTNGPDLLLSAGGNDFKLIESKLLPINITKGGNIEEYYMLLVGKNDMDVILSLP